VSSTHGSLKGTGRSLVHLTCLASIQSSRAFRRNLRARAPYRRAVSSERYQLHHPSKFRPEVLSSFVPIVGKVTFELGSCIGQFRRLRSIRAPVRALVCDVKLPAFSYLTLWPPKTTKVTGRGVNVAERSAPAARIQLQLSVLFWAVTCQRRGCSGPQHIAWPT
jgi:hypothetical protein